MDGARLYIESFTVRTPMPRAIFLSALVAILSACGGAAGGAAPASPEAGWVDLLADGLDRNTRDRALRMWRRQLPAHLPRMFTEFQRTWAR